MDSLGCCLDYVIESIVDTGTLGQILSYFFGFLFCAVKYLSFHTLFVCKLLKAQPWQVVLHLSLT